MYTSNRISTRSTSTNNINNNTKVPTRRALGVSNLSVIWFGVNKDSLPSDNNETIQTIYTRIDLNVYYFNLTAWTIFSRYVFF